MTKKISIVTPCYNEEANIRLCYEAVRDTFASALPDYDYEHIFCDNASQDGSEAILRELARDDSRVRVVLNSRNFGPFHNLFNGNRNSDGDATIVMLAADLQDPVEIIPEMVAKWEEGFKVVYGVRANRKESRLLRQCRAVFYKLVSGMTNFHVPQGAGEFQLIDRQVLKAVLQHEDYYPYMRGIIANCGFKAKGITYDMKPRKRGISSGNAYRLFDQAVNGLISFTNVPMRLAIFIGMTVSLLSVLFALYSVVAQLLSAGSLAPPGTITIIVAIFFLGGVQLFFMGVLGEYLSAVHSQVRKKPLVIEKERLNFPNEPDGGSS